MFSAQRGHARSHAAATAIKLQLQVKKAQDMPVKERKRQRVMKGERATRRKVHKRILNQF